MKPRIYKTNSIKDFSVSIMYHVTKNEHWFNPRLLFPIDALLLCDKSFKQDKDTGNIM